MSDSAQMLSDIHIIEVASAVMAAAAERYSPISAQTPCAFATGREVDVSRRRPSFRPVDSMSRRSSTQRAKQRGS